MSLYYTGDNSYLFANGNEIFKFKAFHNNYPSKFCLGSISKIFDDVESEEISFKENVYMIFQ